MSGRIVFRTVFLAVTVAAVGMELWAANDTSRDTEPWTQLAVDHLPAGLITLAVGALTAWLGPHFADALRRRSTGAPKTAAGRRWLRADAQNKAVRTWLQGILAVAVVPALDAAVQVLQLALARTAVTHRFDWREVATSAGLAAVTASTMVIAAYLHRLKVDPSRVPSAEPPAPPSTTVPPPATTTPGLLPTPRPISEADAAAFEARWRAESSGPPTVL